MATARYQAWTSATWGWDSNTAGSACVELVSELDTWITAINANASQTGKQVVRQRGPADSTTANYRGFVVELPFNSTAASMYVSLHSNSATNLRFYAGDQFTDNTSNGGYGTVTATNGLSSDTSISWKNTITSSAGFVVGYSTVDTEEFFCVGWLLDSSTTYADSLTIYKNTYGEWTAMMNDGNSHTGFSINTPGASKDRMRMTGLESSGASNTLIPYAAYAVTSFLPTNEISQVISAVASEDLFHTPSAISQMDYLTLGDGTNLVSTATYGPLVRYTP